MKKLFRLINSLSFLWLFLMLVVVFAVLAFTATNTVPATRVDEEQTSILINELKPDACAGITIDTIIANDGSTDVFGDKNSELILGNSLGNNIYPYGGDDCVVGGAGNDLILDQYLNKNTGFGNDILLGGPGDDIIYGGAGKDYLIGGSGYDICYGGKGKDTFDPSCEEQYED